jgi:hypothetical protein
VGATPSSREKTGARFGWAAGSGDEASPTPAATGAPQLLAPQLRFSTASFRLKTRDGLPSKGIHGLMKSLGKRLGLA